MGRIYASAEVCVYFNWNNPSESGFNFQGQSKCHSRFYDCSNDSVFNLLIEWVKWGGGKTGWMKRSHIWAWVGHKESQCWSLLDLLFNYAHAWKEIASNLSIAVLRHCWFVASNEQGRNSRRKPDHILFWQTERLLITWQLRYVYPWLCLFKYIPEKPIRAFKFISFYLNLLSFRQHCDLTACWAGQENQQEEELESLASSMYLC